MQHFEIFLSAFVALLWTEKGLVRAVELSLL